MFRFKIGLVCDPKINQTVIKLMIRKHPSYRVRHCLYPDNLRRVNGQHYLINSSLNMTFTVNMSRPSHLLLPVFMNERLVKVRSRNEYNVIANKLCLYLWNQEQTRLGGFWRSFCESVDRLLHGSLYFLSWGTVSDRRFCCARIF